MRMNGDITRLFNPVISRYRRQYGSLGVPVSSRPARPLSPELDRMRPCLLKAQRAIAENPDFSIEGPVIKSPMAVLFDHTLPRILQYLMVEEKVDEALQYLCEYSRDIIDQRGVEGARGNLEAIFKDLPDYLDLQSDREMRGQRIDQTMIIDSPFRHSLDGIKKFVTAVHQANFGGNADPLLSLVFGPDLKTFLTDAQGRISLQFKPIRQINDQELLFLTRPVFAAIQPRIKSLGLEKTGVTDEFMKEIGKLNNLESLALLKTEVTDHGVSNLTLLKGLKFLGLSRTKVTSAVLDIIGQLSDLEILGLDGIDLSGRDFALRPLVPLVKLRELYLNHTLVRTGTLEYLKNNPALTVLSLNGNELESGRASLLLSFLTGLRKLNLVGASLTRFDISSLRQSLPHCEVNT